MTVSINAQVIREFPQNWYYTLLQRGPQHDGELKSSVIIDVFFALPEYERNKVLATLKQVRIHITDPRPYTYDVDEALADLVRDRNVLGFLKRLEKAQRQVARRARAELIARKMWRDAPSYQLRLKHLLYEYQSGLRIDLDPREVMEDDGLPLFPVKHVEFDVSRLERSGKDAVNVFAPYLCKSESVFRDALANMDALLEAGVASPWLVAADVTKVLAKARAFDAGHPDEIAWVGSEREEVVEWIDPHGRFPIPLGRLSEPDSKGSFLLQAADYAGAIAREYWDRNKLPHLVDAFDYVTYNGQRICESQAAAIQADLDKRGSMTVLPN
jgi:hypothetical protein